ncbi:MAG: hypothetical protein JWN40_3781 [Phycisphaerales bacterium]|nr:hypothetical protein [Phycisphaerales bacterium]
MAFTVGLLGPSSDTPTAAFRQDGKTLVAGTQAGSNDAFLARFDADGSLDTTFGDGGKATVKFGGNSLVLAITVDPTGNILAAGSGGGDMAVARFFSNGQIDHSFDSDGVKTVHFASSSEAFAIDAKAGVIAIGGYTGLTGHSSFAVAELDSSSQNTIFLSSTAINASAVINSIVLDGLGNLFAGGESTDVGGQTSFTVAKYNSAGELDAAFDGPTSTGDGVVITPFTGSNSSIKALALDTQLIGIGSTAGAGIVKYNLVTGNVNIGDQFEYAGDGISVRGGGIDNAGRIYATGIVPEGAVNHPGAFRFTGNGLPPETLSAPVALGNNLPSLAVGSDGTLSYAAAVLVAPNDNDIVVGAISSTGVTGPTTTGFTLPTNDVAKAIITDGAGGTLIGGSTSNVSTGTSHGFLIHNAADGSPDTQFNGSSDVLDFVAGLQSVSGIAIDASGRILVAGVTPDRAATVARFDATGTLDHFFNASGVVTVADVLVLDTSATATPDYVVRVATDGSNVIVAGTADTNFGDFFVARYLGTGDIDPAFHAGTVVVTDLLQVATPHSLDASTDIAKALLVLADHRIVIAGSTTSDGNVYDAALVAYTNGGAVDPTFDGDGLVLSPNATTFNALAADASGKIVAAGASGDAIVVARYNPVTGAPDTTFNGDGNNDGVVTFSQFGTIFTKGGANGVTIDSAGRIDVVSATLGATPSQLIVLRLTANGMPDTAFSGDGVALTGVVAGETDPAGIAVDASDNVIVAGTVLTAPNNKDIAVERFLGNATVVVPVIVNPTVAINGAPASSPEGSLISLTSTFTPGSSGTISTYAWSVTKNGNPTPYATGGAPNFTFTPNDNGSYVVTLIVTASDGGTGTDTKTVTVTNVAPTATINGAPTSSPASTPINLTSTVTDPGSLDTFTYDWSVTRDGVAYGTSGTASSYSFTPTDGATYVVTLKVTDNAGAVNATTASINVTASATLSGGILTIAGDSAANTINVTLNAAGNYRVVVGTQINQTFSFSAVSSIIIQAGAGNDIVTIGNGITIAAEIHGAEGNDIVQGGGGNDMIFGEAGTNILEGNAGDDVVVGGAGTDIISGGNGRDILIGGLGSDLITGDNGDDILIAGATVHDTNPAGLASIRSIWSGGSSYNTRVTTLRANLLKAANIFNDTSIDLLSGNNGQDWLIANVAGGGTFDFLLGVAGGEIVTDI